MESVSPPRTPVNRPSSFPLSNAGHQSPREHVDVFTVQMEDRGGSGDFAPIDVDISADVDIEGTNLILAKVEEEVERIEPLNWTIVVRLLVFLPPLFH